MLTSDVACVRLLLRSRRASAIVGSVFLEGSSVSLYTSRLHVSDQMTIDMLHVIQLYRWHVIHKSQYTTVLYCIQS